MVNISIGATLIFIPTGIEVRVADEDHVEYQGRIYKLSPFIGTFMPEDKRNMSGAYQGANFSHIMEKYLMIYAQELRN